MGIRTIIAIVGLSLAITTTHAATNSWTYTGANVNNYHWDATGSWSLGAAPTVNDNQDYITNSSTKTVIINASDAALEPAELTISNLTVAGTAGVINTLCLSNMNAGALVPLHVLGGLTVNTGGVVMVTNSMLKVDGTLLVNGTTWFNNLSTAHASNATFNSSAIMTFTLGTNTNTVVVSNNLTLGGTINVVAGGGFSTNSTYTIFTYGGIFTSNAVTVGTTPPNSTFSVDTSVAGKVNLTISPASSSNVIQLISIARTNTTDIAITWSATGGSTSLVQSNSAAIDGSYTTSNGFADITSSQFAPGGSGVFTNTYTDPGGATNVPPHFYRIHYFQ